jgi:hypothetical protein
MTESAGYRDGHKEENVTPGPIEDAFVAGISSAAAAQAFSALGPVGGVVAAAATPLITHGAGRVVERLHRAIAGRRHVVIAQSAEEAGISTDALLDLVTGDDEKLLIFGLAMNSAATTTLQHKIKLLANVLANVAKTGDRPTIDRERLLLGVVDRLEAPHLHVLHHLFEASTGENPGEIVPVPETVLASGFADPEIGKSALQPVLQTLVQNGLIALSGHGVTYDEWYYDHSENGRDETNTWILTRFGLRLLHRLGPEPSWDGVERVTTRWFAEIDEAGLEAGGRHVKFCDFL